jgi:formyl-CoA transferase
VASVELRSLTKRYGELAVVDDVSLTIEHGRLVCLLGPSGCGKTTTLRLIAGFVEPSAGEIRVGDRVVSSPSRTTPPERRNMSMIFQSYALWPHMTVAENVSYGLELRKINPKLIYASISGFGQTGPYAERPGFDQIAQGMGGLMSITGLPGQGPVRVGIPIADLTAGLFCALGILVALLEREKSKKGQHVTTSLLQAQIFMLDFQGARWLIGGEVPKQAGNNHPTSIPTGVFKTVDGHINIASTGSKIWARFCNAAGATDLLQRPEYQTAADRSKNRDALNADIESYTVKRTSAEWIELLNKAGVPCGPIYTIDQVYADPQVKHLGMAQPVKTKNKSTLYMAGQPMSLSRTPSRLAAPPPALGQHTDVVLKEFGFSGKDIAALRKANAI